VYSWCIRGAFVVHWWRIRGVFMAHSWCIRGVFVAHSWCIRGAFMAHSLNIHRIFIPAPQKRINALRIRSTIKSSHITGSWHPYQMPAPGQINIKVFPPHLPACKH